MLKTNIISLILLAFYLTSCSSVPSRSKGVISSAPPVEDQKWGTVFELLKSEPIQLIFKNVDTGGEVPLSLNKVLTNKVFEEGYWELIGFDSNNKKFHAINNRKRFVLRVKKNQITYGGSIVVGCPRIGSELNHLLKEMTFFDRYTFSSEKLLCELIIGNKLEKLRPELEKSNKINKLKVEVGF